MRPKDRYYLAAARKQKECERKSKERCQKFYEKMLDNYQNFMQKRKEASQRYRDKKKGKTTI